MGSPKWRLTYPRDPSRPCSDRHIPLHQPDQPRIRFRGQNHAGRRYRCSGLPGGSHLLGKHQRPLAAIVGDQHGNRTLLVEELAQLISDLVFPVPPVGPNEQRRRRIELAPLDGIFGDRPVGPGIAGSRIRFRRIRQIAQLVGLQAMARRLCRRIEFSLRVQEHHLALQLAPVLLYVLGHCLLQLLEAGRLVLFPSLEQRRVHQPCRHGTVGGP